MARPKTVLINCGLIILGVSPLILYSYEYGPDPGYTGAPGDNPTGCMASGCHTSSPNTGGGSVKIATLSGTTYFPGQTQQITVTIADSTESKYGFELTARVDNNPKLQSAGKLAPVDAKTQLVDCTTPGVAPFAGSCLSGNTLQWIEHTLAGYTASAPTSTTYSFNWTPPATNIGTVTLYAAGNAGSGRLLPTGTHTYLTTLQLSPSGDGIGPTITSVNSASDFGGGSSFASGSWLEIKGTGLANTTRVWGGSDFNGSNAPTSLDGTSATINGNAAFVYYISPNQINVQAPADSATGSAIPVLVMAPGGMASSSGTKVSLAPGMLAPASFNVNDKQYLVAQFSDGVYVGNAGFITGIASRPAKPGDAITVYGVGFGDVPPPIVPGVVVSSQNTLANPVSIQFGSAKATLTYQGLSPNYVGLYQSISLCPRCLTGTIRSTSRKAGWRCPRHST